MQHKQQHQHLHYQPLGMAREQQEVALPEELSL